MTTRERCKLKMQTGQRQNVEAKFIFILLNRPSPLVHCYLKTLHSCQMLLPHFFMLLQLEFTTQVQGFASWEPENYLQLPFLLLDALYTSSQVMCRLSPAKMLISLRKPVRKCPAEATSGQVYLREVGHCPRQLSLWGRRQAGPLSLQCDHTLCPVQSVCVKKMPTGEGLRAQGLEPFLDKPGHIVFPAQCLLIPERNYRGSYHGLTAFACPEPHICAMTDVHCLAFPFCFGKPGLN